MAEDSETGGEAAKTPQAFQPKTENNKDLPTVESPPLSPASEEPSVAPEPKIEPASSPADDGAALPLPAARLYLRPRHKRQAILAASVTIAACIGAIIGALAMSGMSAPAPDRAAQHERQAMQQSIDKLNEQIAALKADIEAGSKSARSQIAKISERLNHPPTLAPETTGSIPVPPATVPTPQPRPEIHAAAVRDWSIHDVRDGFVYVRGHGDIYQVVLGAPLPGLGPVQQIKRQDGRWVVVTPKGVIVAQRDRRFFEPN
jgi:hypothetical protein